MSEQNEMPERAYGAVRGGFYVFTTCPSERYETPYLRNDYGDDGVVVDANEVMSCAKCGNGQTPSDSTRIAELEAELADSKASAKRLREYMEIIAESHDAGRHDGLPECCPAHDSETMWGVAQTALAAEARAAEKSAAKSASTDAHNGA